MIPVAAPHHPLASIPRPCVPGIIGSLFYPINVRARTRLWCCRPSDWRVGDVELKHRLLLAGIARGGMPELMVCTDIQSERLAQLDVPEYRTGDSPLVVIFKSETQPGPAGIERLLTSLLAIQAQESHRN